MLIRRITLGNRSEHPWYEFEFLHRYTQLFFRFCFFNFPEDDFPPQPTWWNWTQRADFHENSLRIFFLDNRKWHMDGIQQTSSNSNMFDGWRLLRVPHWHGKLDDVQLQCVVFVPILLLIFPSSLLLFVISLSLGLIFKINSPGKLKQMKTLWNSLILIEWILLHCFVVSQLGIFTWREFQ